MKDDGKKTQAVACSEIEGRREDKFKRKKEEVKGTRRKKTEAVKEKGKTGGWWGL